MDGTETLFMHTSRTLPSWAATNTSPKQRTPKAIARNLEMLVALASLIPKQQKGRTKSSKQIAASELRPLDTVLQDDYIEKSLKLIR